MKKLLSLLLFVSCFTMHAQELLVSLNSSVEPGDYINFSVGGGRPDAILEVYYIGDNLTKTYKRSQDGFFHIRQRVMGGTLEIYGDTSMNEFSLGSLNLTYLDLFRHSGLKRLSCSGTFKKLNVSNNTKLEYLDCSNSQLTTLDVSNNTKLKDLDCSKSQLTTLDVSNNTQLEKLDCENNQLTSLLVGNNSKLKYLKCGSNKLKFSTLPVLGIETYEYKPQPRIKIVESTTTYMPIDLGSEFMIDGNVTNYIWKTADGTLLTEGVDYSIDKGVTTFIKAQTEPVYCEMTNDRFNGLTLETTPTNIYVSSSKDNLITMDTSKEIDETIEFSAKGSSCKETMLVDFGDRNLIKYTPDCQLLFNIKGKVKGQTIKIYGDKTISTFNLCCNQLTSLDVSNFKTLTTLRCDSNQLTSLDVSNNSALTTLSCVNNKLKLSTLPIISIAKYDYSPQKQINIVKDIKTYVPIDLKSEYRIEGETTVYTWKTLSGKILTNKVDYSITDGVTRFMKPQTESVYCEMTSELFDDLIIKTTPVQVSERNDLLISMTTAKPLGSHIRISTEKLYYSTNTLQVDFGDGNLKTFTNSPLQYFDFYVKVKGQTIKIYGDKSINSFNLYSNKLTSLDVSNHTQLEHLSCNDNLLTDLDLSSNIALRDLFCTGNQLTSLNLSNNANLDFVRCSDNKLKLSTLPILDVSNYLSYYYSPQQDLSIVDKIDLNTPLDLSSEYLIDGDTTAYIWKTITGFALIEGVDYSIKNGITTFLKPKTEPVYCEMNNRLFEKLTLKTTPVYVPKKQDPIVTMTTTKKIGDIIEFRAKGIDCGVMLMVNFGDGNPIKYAPDDNGYFNVSGKIKDDEIKIYGDSSINAFYLNEIDLVTLDVSNHIALEWLQCRSNQLTSLDVSYNINLKHFDCDNNQLNSLDVSKNTKLDFLACGNNLLKTLDVSNQAMLSTLNCYNNQLTSLDLSNNNALTKVDCSKNRFMLSTLPLIEVGSYEFKPQKPLSINEYLFTNAPLNLGSEFIIDRNITTYYWKTAAGGVLKEGIDYSIDKGVTTFIKAQSEPVYCEMTNELFSGLILKTTPVIVNQEHVPLISMTTAKNIGEEINIGAEGASSEVTLVDFGDGNLISFAPNSDKYFNIKGELKGNTIKIYGDKSISAFYLKSNQLTTLDLSNHTSLKTLDCSRNKLTYLDLLNNTMLENLNCKSNKITSLVVDNNVALTTLDCSWNKLTSLVVDNNVALTTLRCTWCGLTSLDVRSNTALTKLFCSENHLTVLDVRNNLELTELFCSENNLSALEVNNNNSWERLSCKSNKLKFSTLPLLNIGWKYSYESQQSLKIGDYVFVNMPFDLSSEYNINGNNTTYTWKSTTGRILVKGIDYSIEKGVTTFLRAQDRPVYCEMRNSQFSKLTLKTTTINVLVEQPILYKFTTAKNIGEEINFTLAYISSFWVDFGDGNLMKFERDGESIFIDVKGYLKGQTIKIYGDKTQKNDLTIPEFSKITEIDVSNNSNLIGLVCSNNLLTALDVSNNTKLEALYCDQNQLTKLDLRNNTSLRYFKCKRNDLTSLDVGSKNLITLECEHNRLKFSTLPILNNTPKINGYSPQQDLSIVENIEINSPLDLSSEYMIDGNATTYAWKTTSGTILTEGVDYFFENGFTTFTSAQAEPVYCEMKNDLFRKLTLKTTPVNISIPTTIDDSFENKLKVYASNKTVYIKTSLNPIVCIRDISGKVITKKQCYSGVTQINVPQSGIYLVTITVDSKVNTQKVVIR